MCYRAGGGICVVPTNVDTTSRGGNIDGDVTSIRFEPCNGLAGAHETFRCAGRGGVRDGSAIAGSVTRCKVCCISLDANEYRWSFVLGDGWVGGFWGRCTLAANVSLVPKNARVAGILTSQFLLWHLCLLHCGPGLVIRECWRDRGNALTMR